MLVSAYTLPIVVPWPDDINCGEADAACSLFNAYTLPMVVDCPDSSSPRAGIPGANRIVENGRLRACPSPRIGVTFFKSLCWGERSETSVTLPDCEDFFSSRRMAIMEGYIAYHIVFSINADLDPEKWFYRDHNQNLCNEYIRRVDRII